MSSMDHTLTDSLPVDVTGPRSVGWWGMVLFITTESTLFAMLLFSYFYLRAGARAWPPDGIAVPDMARPIIMTAALLLSAITMNWAERSSARGRRAALLLGLGLTLLLSLAFLAIEVVDLSVTNGLFTPRTDAYGSLFFTIEGIDGLHVLGGGAIILFALGRALFGRVRSGRSLVVQNTALFWYFVVVLWLAVFFTLDISPRFLFGH